jgi:hypothetical protein
MSENGQYLAALDKFFQDFSGKIKVYFESSCFRIVSLSGNVS